MIAKISTGNHVVGMVNYNHSKINQTINEEQKGIILGINNIISTDFKDIVDAISVYNSRNSTVAKPNIHISLSFHKDDILDNETIYKIAEDYMKEMDFDEQPYAVYRHFDKEHPHVHIVSSQINLDGKKITDSHNFYHSQKISREIEEKYSITKAVEKNEIFDKKDLLKAINEHLENGKHSLSAIMKRVLQDVLEKKPTDEKQFDRLLEEFQLIRTIVHSEDKTPKGHYFDLRPIEYINNKEEYLKVSHRIQGSELDPLFGLQNIHNVLLNNKIEKEKLLRNMMGRVYFVINPIVTNYKTSLLKQEPIKKEKLSDLIVQLKKKGIELDVKRSQTGDNPNTIYGLLCKDIKESHTYTASDLKIKTKDFLNMIDDDMKNLSTEDKINFVSDDKEVKSKNPFIKNEEDINDKNINALDELFKIFSGHFQNNEESKAPVKKRKRKRRS
jgi:hypothetical protein